MKIKLTLLLVIAMLTSTALSAQDNLTFMHYNLLYYGKYVDDCNPSSNGIEYKTDYLRDILTYVRPDVFTVNELDGEGAEPVSEDEDYLLNNALNVDGTTSYRTAPFSETYNANTLFYNSQKITLYDHHGFTVKVGDFPKTFNGYTFYYNGEDLATSRDTTFFTCFVVHLKAGDGISQQNQRSQEADLLMDSIQHHFPGRGNYFLAGDLNVYHSEEDAFQNLIEPADTTYRFYDPVDQLGEWHASSSFAMYHTQSTHESGDCYSGGGMDDRFDFILLSESMMEGDSGIRYIGDSYRTLGQDGTALNQPLNTQNNATVPQEIANALYAFSDHLPVTLQVRVNSNLADELSVDTVFFEPVTPVENDSVHVYAQFTDTRKRLSQVRLHWGEQSEQYSRDTAMFTDGNYFHGVLPPSSAKNRMYFRVKGYDSTASVILTSDEYAYTVEETNTGFLPRGRSSDDLNVIHPVRNRLVVLNCNPVNESARVVIGDMMGRIRIRRHVRSLRGSRLIVPVANLEPGIYWIRLWNGQQWRSQRFIKK